MDFLRLAGAALLELPQFIVIVTDSDHRIAYWSRGAEQLLEMKADQAIGQRVDQAIYFSDTKQAGKPGQGGLLADGEWLWANRHGEQVPVLWTCIALKDDQQNAAGFLFVMQDLTAQRRAGQSDAEAKEANHRKDKFLAMVVHELRTPLDVMLNWSRLCRLAALNADETSMALATIERNARGLSRLVEDLADISRIVADQLRLDIRRVELLPVIETVIDFERPAAADKQIQIKTAFDSAVRAVAGDPDRLQQIIFNLLSNALKFTPQGGYIGVKLERVEANARITISDSGPGIAEEFLPLIFNPFSRANTTSTPRGSGLGLGLAIVQYLVELHRGTIQVDSRVGHGASFTVELPRWNDLLVAPTRGDGRVV